MQACTVVIPTYNERENLAGIVDRVLAVEPSFDVLVVDDASPDGTGVLADELAAASDRVRVLHRSRKDGLGQAYLDAFALVLATGVEYVAELDADGSFAPEDLPALVRAAEAGADLVIGARWMAGGGVRNWPLHRRVISRSGTAYARFALRSRLHDLTSGFRVFRTAALRGADLDEVASHGYGFQVEMAWRFERAGRDVREVPVTFVEREHGASKMSLGIVAEAFWRVTRWGVALRLGRDRRTASVQATRPSGPARTP